MLVRSSSRNIARALAFVRRLRLARRPVSWLPTSARARPLNSPAKSANLVVLGIHARASQPPADEAPTARLRRARLCRRLCGGLSGPRFHAARFHDARVRGATPGVKLSCVKIVCSVFGGGGKPPPPPPNTMATLIDSNTPGAARPAARTCSTPRSRMSDAHPRRSSRFKRRRGVQATTRSLRWRPLERAGAGRETGLRLPRLSKTLTLREPVTPRRFPPGCDERIRNAAGKVPGQGTDCSLRERVPCPGTCSAVEMLGGAAPPNPPSEMPVQSYEQVGGAHIPT